MTTPAPSIHSIAQTVEFAARALAEFGPGMRSKPYFTMRTREPDGTKVYRAVWRVWDAGRVPADRALAFRATWHTDAELPWVDATERLPLHPSVACAHIRVSLTTAHDMLERLERVELRPLAAPQTDSIRDSTHHSLRFARSFFKVNLEWYDDGPRSWEGLAEATRTIANEMDGLLESPDASTTTPY